MLGAKKLQTWFVVATSTAIGSMKSRAIAHANRIPQYGSCNCLLNPSQVKKERPRVTTKIVINHHCGTGS
ncbi:hypothetical protein J5N97_006533 [Dioscorea zingiberensis]|uniref:Uncharacterized protein n=1 Tax=Dioscorea zingiberensis TaxID=325984 RepID=A0A9D5DD88_9LILI|nr:hypothetical protein J5N97_006533 [Dioscorea zingiberensis]